MEFQFESGFYHRISIQTKRAGKQKAKKVYEGGAEKYLYTKLDYYGNAVSYPFTPQQMHERQLGA